MARENDDARVISITDEQRRKARRVPPAEPGSRQRTAARRSGARRSGSRGGARSVEAAPIAVAEDQGRGLISGLLSDPRLRKWGQFIRRRLEGQYWVDEYGYDEELTDEVLLPLLRPVFHRYFRVEIKGVEHVPSRGPAIIAANHSGVLPWDAIMLLTGLKEEHPARPVVRLMGHDLVWSLPFLSEWARKAGNTVAGDADALRMLRDGELIAVFPEGTRGLGKPFRDRYRLQRFGRQGFVKVALQTGTPVIPAGIVGAEEIYPMLGDITPLARMLGFPYFPITPFFPLLGPIGALPLPTKWIIEFGPPIDLSTYGSEAATDAMTVFNIGDGIRDTIQQILYRNLMHRRTWFW